MANERHSYVEFYPSDWTAGTAYMPALVEWLYLQVCIYNWDKREALPANQAPMRFSRSPSWREDLEMLVDSGKVIRTQSGGLFVERAMVAANKAYDLWERKSRGGKNRHAKGSGDESSRTPDSTHPSNQNQNQNHSPQGDSPPSPPAGDLFFTVPADALKAFRDHRTKLKVPMTLRAEELMVGKLEKIFTEHGHDPTDVIDQSIANGWKGVFPLKDEQDGTGNRNGTGEADRRGGLARAIDRRLEHGRPDRPH